MIRWYALDAHNGEPRISPISRQPYVWEAPDKAAAQAHIDRCLPFAFLAPMSVCEYEALQELASAARRAKAYDDALLAFAKTLPIPTDPEDDRQASLCGDVLFWKSEAA